ACWVMACWARWPRSCSSNSGAPTRGARKFPQTGAAGGARVAFRNAKRSASRARARNTVASSAWALIALACNSILGIDEAQLACSEPGCDTLPDGRVSVVETAQPSTDGAQPADATQADAAEPA